jgi:uncharacterized protein YjbI with pentapeptide repeats
MEISNDEMNKILNLHQQWLSVAGWQHEFNVFFKLPTDETWPPNEPATDPKFQQLQNDPRRAVLCGADLVKWARDNLELQGAVLEGADMQSANLKKANLDYTDLRFARLDDAHLTSVGFLSSDLEHAVLDGASLVGADFDGADLRNSSLARTDLRDAYFIGANLQSAFLQGAKLVGADLTNSNLTKANFINVDLRRTKLQRADMLEAQMVGANLKDADLRGLNLSQANFARADLEDSDLKNANLKRTILEGADLEGASMVNSNLDRAYLARADLSSVIFEPDLTLMPDIQGLADAKNLDRMLFEHSPTALVIVRKQFKAAGLREQENQITRAIRHSEMLRKGTNGTPRHGIFERCFSYIFFEWTCEYGMSPGRPLLIVIAIAVLLSVVYIFAQIDPGATAGIWAVWDEHQIMPAEGAPVELQKQLRDGFPFHRSQISFLLLALYFSLLSATRIGWRELNVGTWLTRIQPREYSLRATGWVRVVSGVQSLISVYLVALSILTYFGTPFE